jgi:hypothetical protein
VSDRAAAQGRDLTFANNEVTYQKAAQKKAEDDQKKADEASKKAEEERVKLEKTQPENVKKLAEATTAKVAAEKAKTEAEAPQKKAADPKGNALWDLAYNMADSLGAAGRKIVYCPGGYTAVQNSDYWWNYNGGTGYFRVTSYQWLLSRDGTQTYGVKLVAPPTGIASDPQRGYLLKITQTFTNSLTLSDSEMVTDVIISEGGGLLTDKFNGVYTVNPTELPKGLNSSHMAGTKPAGGNSLFQDNHVSWRNFKNTKAWGQWSGGVTRWFWY